MEYILYTYIIDYIVIARACVRVRWYKQRKQEYNTSEVGGAGAVGERWQRGGRGGSGGGGNSNSKGASSTTATAAAVLFTSNAP